MNIEEFKQEVLPTINKRKAALELKEDPTNFFEARIVKYWLNVSKIEKFLYVCGYKLEIVKIEDESQKS
jgi:hypothetical protein